MANLLLPIPDTDDLAPSFAATTFAEDRVSRRPELEVCRSDIWLVRCGARGTPDRLNMISSDPTELSGGYLGFFARALARVVEGETPDPDRMPCVNSVSCRARAKVASADSWTSSSDSESHLRFPRGGAIAYLLRSSSAARTTASIRGREMAVSSAARTDGPCVTGSAGVTRLLVPGVS